MDLKDLRQASAQTGHSTDQLRWYIKRGRLMAYQPGGPRGKLYVSAEELERLMQPVTPKEQR